MVEVAAERSVVGLKPSSTQTEMPLSPREKFNHAVKISIDGNKPDFETVWATKKALEHEQNEKLDTWKKKSMDMLASISRCEVSKNRQRRISVNRTGLRLWVRI